MILGIGNDVLEVSRMAREVAKGGPFRPGEVFTAAELAYCDSQRYPARHLAARFAAKEALYKALGTGAPTPGALGQVEVVRRAAGAPTLVLSGSARQAAARRGVTRIFVSLAHTPTVASAVVVLEH
ncbi:MAG TPA: holo-ACP synthase [Polyangia bacterium]|jgi:holo-[acyl-carrier protein] synthase